MVGRTNDTQEGQDNKDHLTLGRFGPAAVSLFRDNEEFPRYFLVVGAGGRSSLRLSLAGEDITHFIEALRQVVDDIPRK